MEVIDNLIGLQDRQPQPAQMVARAVIIFFISIVFIRIAGLRTLGKRSVFDTLTLLMLGAIMGRAIVANQSFFGTMVTALLLMLMHRLVAWLSFKSRSMGRIFKGENIMLVKDGMYLKENMAKERITENDILEAVRDHLNTSDLKKVKEAYLERSGSISIIKE